MHSDSALTYKQKSEQPGVDGIIYVAMTLKSVEISLFNSYAANIWTQVPNLGLGFKIKIITSRRNIPQRSLSSVTKSPSIYIFFFFLIPKYVENIPLKPQQKRKIFPEQKQALWEGNDPNRKKC